MSTLAEQLRAAFEEGWQVGFEEGIDPCGAGKPMPGGHGAYDPPDMDRVWERSEAFKSVSAQPVAQDEVIDRFTAVTRDMARSS